MASTEGYFALLLHAHLPFVRHLDQERAFEENWLFEAITESYLPLIQIMEGWLRDGLRPRITLSISPTLSAMLQDPVLQDRYRQRMALLIELSRREQLRTHLNPALRSLAEFYTRCYQELETIYLRWSGNLNRAWRFFHQEGLLELATCSATHAVLPLYAHDGASLRAQIALAIEAHHSSFGHHPRGFWLPECAYTAAVERPLIESQIAWFVVENHGLLSARPRPRRGTFAPIMTPSSLAVFGRDDTTARQVWSRNGGYPGDPRYRDFYRDVGFDLDLDYLQPFLPVPSQRTPIGIKYHRIRSFGNDKEIYRLDDARSAIHDQAKHFCQLIRSRLASAQAPSESPPIIVAPFDAELFGHWWFEGPAFLDLVVRGCLEQPGPILATPSDYLSQHPAMEQATPADSSWGEGGYWQLWLNDKTGWIHSHLRIAQRRMHQLISQYGGTSELNSRALKQAGRELLLAQASDWPFMIKTDCCPDYAQRRIRQHLRQFHHLGNHLESNTLTEAEIAALESVNNIFPHIRTDHWGNGRHPLKST